MKKIPKEEWRKIVENFSSSGKTQAQWSKENNIKPKQLSYWVRKFIKEDTNSNKNDSNFIKANIISNSNLPDKESIIIEIDNLKIAIKPGFDRRLLVEVIEVLKTVS